jgi:hypothetical protein
LKHVFFLTSDGGIAMSFEERIESLRSKHALLEAALKDEIQRPLPDPATTTRIKREKLRLKDEMMRLSHN